MQINLNELPEYISQQDAALFQNSFENFGEKPLTMDEKQRILSSVMGKAGIKMKETINTKRKHSKKIVGIGIAAAVSLTGAVGAYAVNTFAHRESVGYFIDDVESLETAGYVEEQVQENERLRITLDTLMSDGLEASLIFTAETFDSEGDVLLAVSDMFASNMYKLYYADTGEPIECEGGILSIGGEKFWSNIELDGVDTSREILFRFGIREDPTTDAEDDLSYYELSDQSFTFTVSLAPNVDVVILKNDLGEEVMMSQFEIVLKGKEIFIDIDDIRLIKNDGSLEPIPNDNGFRCCGTDDNRTRLFFGDFIDLDDYSGIEMNGTEYYRQ